MLDAEQVTLLLLARILRLHPHDNMKPPSHQNGKHSANVGRIVHVASAQKPPQVGDILRDEPTAILRHVNVRCLEISVEQTAEAKQEREPHGNEQRPQRDAKHSAMTQVNEATDTNEQTNRNAHPP